MNIQSVIQVFLIVAMLIATFVIYRFNVHQTTKQKALVEKFVERVAKHNTVMTKMGKTNDEDTIDPLPFSNEDYEVYKKIIAVFKHEVGNPPKQEELFKCFEKIKDKTMTHDSLKTLLHKDPKNYHVKLFPELVKHTSTDLPPIEPFEEPENPDDGREVEDEPVVNENETEPLPDNVENEEEATMLESTKVEHGISTSAKDKSYMLNDSKNQYVFNRPTIYNIMHPDATEHTFKSISTMMKNLPSSNDEMDTNSVNTTALIEAIKKSAVDNDADDDDIEEERVEDYKNRCQTEEEFADQNKLATRQERRNFNELKFACNRSKYANNKKYDFDPMVLRYDQSWQMPYKKPPLCTMDSKQKCKVTPVQTQTALIGTLLTDAKDTKIGSIMPDFKFEENKGTTRKKSTKRTSNKKS